MTNLYISYIICVIQVSILAGQIWLLNQIEKRLEDDQKLMRKMTEWSIESRKFIQELKETKE